MRTRRKLKKIAFDVLEAAALGIEIIYATKRYQRIMVSQGLGGLKRIVEENRQRDIIAWIRRAKRAKLVKAERIGQKLRVALNKKGYLCLLEKRIRNSPKLPPPQILLVSFDFPLSQKSSREAFRYFLKTNGFEKLQQSLWRTQRDVWDPLLEFVNHSGTRSWIRIFLAQE